MRGVLGILFLFCVLAGTSWYLASRLYHGFAAFFPQIRFWPFLVLVCALTLLLVLGFMRALMPFPVAVKRVLGVVSSYCMGVFVYLLLFTIVADLLLCIPRLMKLPLTAHPLFRGIPALAVLLATLVTCIYGFVNARQIDHVSYEISLPGKADLSDLRIVMISDLHLGAVGSESRLGTIVEELNAQQPDLVCIAGDVFDTDFSSIQNPEVAIRTLREIRATYGVYACLGNHDGGQTFAQMTDFLEAANIHLLNDTYVEIDNRLILLGRLDGSAIGGYGDQQRKALSDFFVREDPSLPVIVLDHNPANLAQYSDEADLILSGHTHKGQIFPANLITNWIYTVDYGYYQEQPGSPQVIVTSGVGTWGMPMRVASDCEIVTIQFTPSEAAQ